MIELPNGLHGAYHRSWLADAIGSGAVRSLQLAGGLVPFARTVLVDRRRMLELPTRAAAALLVAGPGAVLTSHTAALVHGCSAADAGVIHVLTGYARKVRRRQDIDFHQGRVDEQDVLELDGLRVLVLDVVIAEMLCTASRTTALACADQALAEVEPRFRGAFTAEVAHRIRSRLDPRGRRRAEALLGLATGVPESPAESWLLLTLFDAGLPVPLPQHPVSDLDGRERYRLDFAWPEARVALEYDGYAAHAGRAELDAARDEDLHRRGWIVIRATARDLRDPTRLLGSVRAAFARRQFVA